MNRKYDDIIHMSHHESKKHPRMPVADRAAQFSPFAALTGYADAIWETARQTTEKPELDEHEKVILDRQLAVLSEAVRREDSASVLWISVSYFKPDEKKTGGRIVTVEGVLRRIDRYRRVLVLADNVEIPVDEIVRMEHPLLEEPL